MEGEDHYTPLNPTQAPINPPYKTACNRKKCGAAVVTPADTTLIPDDTVDTTETSVVKPNHAFDTTEASVNAKATIAPKDIVDNTETPVSTAAPQGTPVDTRNTS